MLALFLWLLLLWSLAPLAFPLARRVWTLGTSINSGADSDTNLNRPVPWPDGGWAAGRMLALVLWTLGAFWAGHAGLPVRQGWILLGPALVISGVAWARGWKPLREELRQRARAIAIVDGAFLLVFAAFLLLRCLWPDLDTGERPMDIALASACARADSLPPPNPYLAGTRLGGYYYLGHLQTALLTTTVGTELRWSYNFGCATIPALCASLALPLAAFLCASWKRGAWASLILLGAGTLEPLRQWAVANETGFRAWPLSAWNERSLDYFSTSRVIPNPGGSVHYTINEYPFFTSTYGDLHAHFFSQPIALLLMSLGAALFLNRRSARAGSPFGHRVLLAGAVLAALMVTNTWDVPAYWLLFTLCLFAPCRSHSHARPSPPRQPNPRPQVLASEMSKSARRRQRRALLEGERASVQVLARASQAADEAQLQSGAGDCISARVLSGLLVAATVVMIGLAVPYVRNVHTNATPPTPLDLPATPPISWLLMWGPFALAWSLALWRAWREDERFFFRPAWLLAPVGLWLALKFAPSGSFSFDWLRPEYPGSPLPYVVTYSWGKNAHGADYFSLLALSTLLVLSLRGAIASSEARFSLLCRLAVCGLVPLIWSELTWAGFLDRGAQDSAHRQDTAFKFGLQGWFLFGLASIASALGPRPAADEGRAQSQDDKPSRARGLWRSWAWPVRAVFGAALSVMFVSSALCVWGRGLIKSSEAMRHQSEEAIARGQTENRPFLARFASTFRAPDAWAHLAPPEQEAAAWMARRARDGDSLLEAEKSEGGDYTNYTRYGHATGIPTIIGPKSHTFQWGSGKLEAGEVWALVDKRKAQVRGAFLSNGAALRDAGWRQAWKNELGLRFIVLGQLEREEYGAPAIDAMIASAPNTRVFGQSDDPHRVVIVDLGSS